MLKRGREEGSRPSAPEEILLAATVEFAGHGFAGARIDRIATRAHVSKGIIYYHFRSKRLLYQEVLRRIYSGLIGRLTRIAESDLTPGEKLSRIIADYAETIQKRPCDPVLLLRELCEGGTHLDKDTLKAFAGIPQTIFQVLNDGIADGSFRRGSLLAMYYLVMGPVVMFFVGAQFRARANTVANVYAAPQVEFAPDHFIKHIQDMVLAALSPERPDHVAFEESERTFLPVSRLTLK